MQVERAASSGAEWYQNPLNVAPRGLTLQSIRLIYAGSREPASGLEPLSCSLRVIIHALHGFARACKSKGFPLLRLAMRCTVLRSRWCQSGVNIILIFAGHPRPPTASQIQSTGLTNRKAKSRLGHRPEGFAIRPSREYGV